MDGLSLKASTLSLDEERTENILKEICTAPAASRCLKVHAVTFTP
jgi:hypothetical protein